MQHIQSPAQTVVTVKLVRKPSGEFRGWGARASEKISKPSAAPVGEPGGIANRNVGPPRFGAEVQAPRLQGKPGSPRERRWSGEGREKVVSLLVV